MFPLLLILIGAFFLFQNSNWTFDFSLSWGFYWPVVIILIGLIIAVKRRS